MSAYSPADIAALRKLPLAELMSRALAAKISHRGDAFALCSIINAKSGKCSEDCRFCVQSGHYQTDAPVYPLQDEEAVLAAAAEAKRIGAEHFSIVTSGRGLVGKDLERVIEPGRQNPATGRDQGLRLSRNSFPAGPCKASRGRVVSLSPQS